MGYLQIDEILNLMIIMFGISYFWRGKRGLYPDTLRRWVLFLIRNSIPDLRLGITSIRTGDEYEKVHDSPRRLMLFALSCVYCFAWWSGVAYALLFWDNELANRLFTVLGIAAIMDVLWSKLNLTWATEDSQEGDSIYE